MSFGPATPGGRITAAEMFQFGNTHPQSNVIPSSVLPQSSGNGVVGPNGSTGSVPNAQATSNTTVDQTTTFGTINITQANPGVFTLGGGGGGGIDINQQVQNQSETNTQIANTYAPITNLSEQTTNTISNVINYLIGGGSIGPSAITPSPSIYNIPTSTVSPGLTSSQGQTADQSASLGGGKTDYMTLLIVGGVVLVVAYFLLGRKKK